MTINNKYNPPDAIRIEVKKMKNGLNEILLTLWDTFVTNFD